MYNLFLCLIAKLMVELVIDSNFQNRNQFSITSGQWHMLCTVKWVKNFKFGGVFDLAVEQLQLFRKLPQK